MVSEQKFWRLRQIIIDAHAFVDGGISFDTAKAHENGYSDEEIADAEYLLIESSYFVKDFVQEIKQITANASSEFGVFFVEFAKIIFVTHKDSQKSKYFFEEDLQKMVLLNQYLGFCNDFLAKKPAA